MVNQKVAFSKATDTHLCEAMSLVIVITIVTRHLFMNILLIILIEKLRRWVACSYINSFMTKAVIM